MRQQAFTEIYAETMCIVIVETMCTSSLQLFQKTWIRF